ncbi:MAG TPA: hypothetical protein VJX23_14930 [Candidatus Binataceae bacterium]|nr:hypothetical protein [Candidatus Binataceae bacterium]
MSGGKRGEIGRQFVELLGRAVVFGDRLAVLRRQQAHHDQAVYLGEHGFFERRRPLREKAWSDPAHAALLD